MPVSRPKSFKSRTINDLSNCCSQHSCSLNVLNARDVCNNNSSTLKPSPHLQHFSGNTVSQLTVAQMYIVFPQLFSKYFHQILETVGNNWDTFSLVLVTKTVFSFPKPNGKPANILLPHSGVRPVIYSARGQDLSLLLNEVPVVLLLWSILLRSEDDDYPVEPGIKLKIYTRRILWDITFPECTVRTGKINMALYTKSWKFLISPDIVA